MRNIAIMFSKPRYLITSMQGALTGRYNVLLEKAEVNNLSKIHVSLNGVIVYVDEELLRQRAALTFLKDKAIEDGFPIFVIGELTEVKEVEEVLGKELITEIFLHPINTMEAAEIIRKYVDDYYRQDKKKILVVDDSAPMLRTIKLWLDRKYSVSLANSGTMAIKHLSLNRPDLILLDYEMPICNGKQVYQMIHAEMEFADVPIMFLTGKNDKESIMSVMELKPAGYLLKTLGSEQIIAAIDEFFDKQQKAKIMSKLK